MDTTTAIGYYLGYASVGSAYGAAGSMVVLLVWVYYSALIVFFGAEFTPGLDHASWRRHAPATCRLGSSAPSQRRGGRRAHPRVVTPAMSCA